MALRRVHYEAAFEDYLRSLGWPYVTVDEQRKAIFSGSRVKSFDFLVRKPGGGAWLADVKGRKFPYEARHTRRFWENWVTRDDLDSLAQWETAFGPGFEPVFVFAYWLTGVDNVDPSPSIHSFAERSYAFLVTPVRDYLAHARPRSPKWQTVTVPTAAFKRIVHPVHEQAQPPLTLRPSACLVAG